MRKVIVIILLVIYSSTNIGATVHLHYCMNELVHLNFWKNSNKKCGKCGMIETKNGCCEDKEVQLKLDVEHQKSIITQLQGLINITTILYLPHIDFKSLFFVELNEIFPGWYSPPLAINSKPNIFYCVFII